MLRNTIFLMWISGLLLAATVGTSIWAVQQTIKVANLTAEVLSSASEIATAKAVHRQALTKQKAQLKAKARMRRAVVAIPALGAALAVYFEEKDFQEWLQEHPNGDRLTYACEVANISSEVVDSFVIEVLTATKNLPKYVQPDGKKILSWVALPECTSSTN